MVWCCGSMIKWRLSVHANAEIAPYFIVALAEATDGKIGLRMGRRLKHLKYEF